MQLQTIGEAKTISDGSFMIVEDNINGVLSSRLPMFLIKYSSSLVIYLLIYFKFVLYFGCATEFE